MIGVVTDDVGLRAAFEFLVGGHADGGEPLVQVLDLEETQFAAGLEVWYGAAHHQLVKIADLDSEVICRLGRRQHFSIHMLEYWLCL